MCPVEFKKENEASGFLVRCEADVGGAGALQDVRGEIRVTRESGQGCVTISQHGNTSDACHDMSHRCHADTGIKTCDTGGSQIAVTQLPTHENIGLCQHQIFRERES